MEGGKAGNLVPTLASARTITRSSGFSLLMLFSSMSAVWNHTQKDNRQIHKHSISPAESESSAAGSKASQAAEQQDPPWPGTQAPSPRGCACAPPTTTPGSAATQRSRRRSGQAEEQERVLVVGLKLVRARRNLEGLLPGGGWGARGHGALAHGEARDAGGGRAASAGFREDGGRRCWEQQSAVAAKPVWERIWPRDEKLEGALGKFAVTSTDELVYYLRHTVTLIWNYNQY